MKRSKIKDHIIETASRLFYKNGYNSTGINEIISEAGIAKATLYNHFKSKDDVCLAYLNHKNTVFLKELKSYCSSKNVGNDQLLGIFEFLEDFYSNVEFNGCWCIKTIAEIPKEDQKIRKEIQNQKKLFMDLIKSLLVFNKANLGSDRINSLTKQIYLLYEGAVSESHLHGDNWPIKESKNVCELILS